MGRLRCNKMTLAAAIAIASCGCNAMAWESPKSKLRKPNDAILKESGFDEPDRHEQPRQSPGATLESPVVAPEVRRLAEPSRDPAWASTVDTGIIDTGIIDTGTVDKTFVGTKLSVSSASSDTQSPVTRVPNGALAWAELQEVPIPPHVPRPRYVVLGQRNDALEETYVLDGVRGQESPAGTQSGRYATPGFERAGHPQCISRHAQPGLDLDHSVGYIGGGTPFYWGGRGQSRTRQEGTFGMDYSGWLVSRHTWLKWSHGGRYQGGAGRYETDGPRLLPEK